MTPARAAELAKAWAGRAAYWAPAWLAVSLPMGASRGWCPASVGWLECTTGSLGYTGLWFAGGYWATKRLAPGRPAIAALGGIGGAVAFYLFTLIGR